MDNLKPSPGSIKRKKRIGRGPGSGTGKTSAKGQKGQKSRKGANIRIGFEGGQTPLYRRLPKKGFTNSRFKKNYNEINLFILNNFEDGSVIGIEEYKKLGIINNEKDKVKVLSNGKLEKKLEVHANKFSKNAIISIEKAGGKAIIIGASGEKAEN